MKNYSAVLKGMILLLLFQVSLFTYAKTKEVFSSLITVTGTVVNENGEPVIATVSVKGSVKATTTNGKGVFILKDVDEHAVLIISGINIETFEVEVKGRNDLGILKATTKVSKEKEVVVEANTGYYSAKPNEMNGSVVVIDNKTLNQQVGTNILDRLDGVTSGLSFNNKSNTNPQSNLGITIRGLSTINGPLNPLVVLDNFIYDGDIKDINPNDIASITVLKDAAATSIYGALGGNGVIVLTSKKGQFKQPLKVEFNSTLIVSQKPDLFKLPQISSSDYIDVEQFLYKNGYYDDQITYDWYYHSAFTPAVNIFIQRANGDITAADSASMINSLKKIDIRNQYDKYFYSNPITQQYAINLSGGSYNNAYFLSADYDRNLSDLSEKFNKINIKVENTFKPIKNLELNVGAYYTSSQDISGKPSSVTLGGKYVPYLQLADSKGNPLPVPVIYGTDYTDTAGAGKLLNWNYYPLEDYKHDRLTTNEEQLITNIGLKYQVLKGLDIDIKYQIEKQTVQSQTLADTASFSTRNLINQFSQINYSTGVVNYIVPDGAILSLDNNVETSENLRGQVNYNYLKGKNNLSFLAGAETRQILNSDNAYTIYGYNQDPLTTAAVDFVNPYPTFVDGSYQNIPGAPSLSSTTDRFVSIFSNFSYLYNNRYSLSGSARKDGANIFGANTNDQWKPLWSGGVGWILSNEKFFNHRSISYLRVKATYGYSGNVDLSKTALPVANANSSAPFTNLPYLRIITLNNPDLKWEQSAQFNTGIDFSIKNQIVSGSIEYYIKKGTDLYGETPYDYTTWGAQNEIIKNVASMRGNGIDLVLDSKNIDRNFKWTTNLIMNYNNSKTTAYYSSDAETGINIIGGGGSSISPVIGKPLYAIATYKWAGLNNVGDPQGYLNGEKSTDYNAIDSDISVNGLKSKSVVYNGSAIPVITGSLINTFSYKGFSMSINVAYKLGYYFTKPTLSYSALFSEGLGSSDFDKRWQKPGDEFKTNVPALEYTSYPQFGLRDAFYAGADINVLRADQIRLQYINLNYTFANNKSPWKKNLELYVNASNLGILWRANKEHLDPDYPASIPPLKTFAVGIKAIF